jgi:DNA polymerase
MSTPTKPDFRKSLPFLRSEWEGCTRCALGVYRNETNSAFVFGEGTAGGIMFVGEGPGKDEAAEGRPFVGASGRLIRHVIARLGVTQYYITNAVCCRSCKPDVDGEGKIRTRINYRTRREEQVIRDEPPKPLEIDACRARLYEEVYLVDPTIIVALGKQAADALARRSVSITAECGKPTKIFIPGAGAVPSITEKKKVWARKVRSELVLPTEPSEVEYLMVPVFHPAYVLSRQAEDPSKTNTTLRVFLDALKKAVVIHNRMRLEVYGDSVDVKDIDESDVFEDSKF